VFLGRHLGAPLFGIAVDPGAVEALKDRNDLLVTDLRSIATGALVAPEHLPPLAAAKALLGWHRQHRFCSNCGAPTRLTQAGWRRDCPACGAEHFPRTDPVVIMLAIHGERCLLGRQSRFAKGMWSCLAGFVDRRNHRRCGAAGNPGGGRHRVRTRRLFRVAAVALPDVADDRLSCPGIDYGTQG
jgi:NAD+ diphosphatase